MALNENAKKWVDALRSGKYQQGKMKLRYNGRYCCLGVACEVAKREGVIPYFCGSAPFLPLKVRRWLRLESMYGSFGDTALTIENDKRGKTFAEIADIIESEPEGLFAPTLPPPPQAEKGR